MGHVLQKGFEAGGIIGGLLVAPGTVAYQTLYKKQQSVDILEVAQNAAISCAAGVGLSGEWVWLGLGRRSPRSA
jgi:hypothetical protein